MKFETVIGLEIHVELATKTKIFCNCENVFGGEENTHCCPVCLGLPGSLPVMNQSVVDYAARVGPVSYTHLGLPPLWTMCAMYAGFRLFGFIGLFLGPLTLLLMYNVAKMYLQKRTYREVLADVAAQWSPPPDL